MSQRSSTPVHVSAAPWAAAWPLWDNCDISWHWDVLGRAAESPESFATELGHGRNISVLTQGLKQAKAGFPLIVLSVKWTDTNLSVVTIQRGAQGPPSPSLLAPALHTWPITPPLCLQRKFLLFAQELYLSQGRPQRAPATLICCTRRARIGVLPVPWRLHSDKTHPLPLSPSPPPLCSCPEDWALTELPELSHHTQIVFGGCQVWIDSPGVTD